MGMIVTLYLISENVYNSVDAPKGRGFSYIEVWKLGTQMPIILALCEYGLILHLKKIAKKSNGTDQTMDQKDSEENLDERIKKLDYATMIFNLFYITGFASLYWIILYGVKMNSFHENSNLESQRYVQSSPKRIHSDWGKPGKSISYPSQYI